MKTLEQIKNDYAVSKGFKDWNNLFISVSHAPRDLEKHTDNICIIAQKECLKLANMNLSLEVCGFDDIDYGITNENNIIK